MADSPAEPSVAVEEPTVKQLLGVLTKFSERIEKRLDQVDENMRPLKAARLEESRITDGVSPKLREQVKMCEYIELNILIQDEALDDDDKILAPTKDGGVAIKKKKKKIQNVRDFCRAMAILTHIVQEEIPSQTGALLTHQFHMASLAETFVWSNIAKLDEYLRRAAEGKGSYEYLAKAHLNHQARFLHTPRRGTQAEGKDSSNQLAGDSKLCWPFVVRGSCPRGNKCRFQHQRPPQVVTELEKFTATNNAASQ